MIKVANFKSTGEKMNKEFWEALDNLVRESEIVIDRPKGTVHPRYQDLVYKVDYGYLKNTFSMDGGGIDVQVGSDEKKCVDAIMCIIDLKKRDSEIKILIGCTEEEKGIVYKTHNESEYMKVILIRRQNKVQLDRYLHSLVYFREEPIRAWLTELGFQEDVQNS